MKSKSYKEMMNKESLETDPWETPNKISSHELHAEFILVLYLQFVK